MRNKENGITLIALVITIIVLLILAGVSISTLTGDNGILVQAQKANDNSQIAEVEERINLWRAEMTAYDATRIGSEPQDEEGLLEELKKDGLVEEENLDKENKIITLNGIQISYGYQVAFNEEEGVNNPTISDGMIPIKWVENYVYNDEPAVDTWVICSQYNENWFEYIDQETENKNGNIDKDTTSMWANVMLSDGKYDDITEVGTPVATADLGSMFVWIPRYSYSITSGYHSNNEGTIEIKFLKGTTDTAVDGTKNWDNEGGEYGEGNWNVHPAFTFGEELTGIWVAKFEASKSTNGDESTTTTELTVLPNVQSWVSVTISTMFDAAINMNEENNVYGISSSDSEIDPHMMLNSEWGAVSYLTQSSYGRNGVEVSINSAGKKTAGSATVDGYLLEEILTQTTTGNVTGIYDMNGTSWEYVAAYIEGNIENELLSEDGNGGSLVSNSNSKYVEVYNVGDIDGTNQSANYVTFSNIYGDAVWETSYSGTENTSWYSDYSNTPCSTSPFFARGGNYDNSTLAGLFAFYNTYGTAYSDLSFRPVLAL